MPTSELQLPSAFLSYSWTSDEYADKVEQFARDLNDAGVHIVLDQWDLVEGQDKYAFMERCVTDPAIDKVLILIDPRYTERADSREGGVGHETLIISPEVYGRADQERFIPVIMGRDESDQIRLPAYLRGRIYIDLSDPERYEEQFERLVRNLHGKPQRERPTLGRRPSYLDEDAVQLSTGRSLAAFRNALLQEKRGQVGYLADYLERLASAYAAELISGKESVSDLELAVSESIDRWRPYRDEFIELLNLLVRYGERVELYDQLHSFFERLVNIREGDRSQWSNGAGTENLAFVAWEMLLYAIGMFLRGRRFDAIRRLMSPYHVTDWAGRNRMESVETFRQPFPLIEDTRQKRLGTRWLVAGAVLLRERASNPADWPVLMEADTLLWARSVVARSRQTQWYPLTGAFMEHEGPGSLPLWTRARADEEFFAALAPVLGLRDRDEARARVAELPERFYMTVGNMYLSRQTLQFILGVAG